MMRNRRTGWILKLVYAATQYAILVCVAVPAAGQVRLPQLPIPALPQLPLSLPPAANGLDLSAATTDPDSVVRQRIAARRLQARALIRANPQLIEADPAGAPLRRAELVALAPVESALQREIADGFAVLRRQSLAELETDIVVLRAPMGLSTRRALARLRSLDPQGSYDYNHLYVESGAGADDGDSAGMRTAPPAHAGAAVHVGMIDGGVDRSHPALATTRVESGGCDGSLLPGAHGTAVASLIAASVGASSAGASSAGPTLDLHAVDVYCGQPTGGAVDALATAFASLLRAQVRVINISLVGPRNVTLEMLVRAVQAHGILLVAAVGNDGPAAMPLYPAALPGVIAVTAVDAQRRVLPEAGRGAHVQFAAQGADMKAADAQHGYSAVRGTSFAAPLVTGLLAQYLADEACSGEMARQRLIQAAIDLGAPGRDPVYGYGLVGMAPY